MDLQTELKSVVDEFNTVQSQAVQKEQELEKLQDRLKELHGSHATLTALISKQVPEAATTVTAEAPTKKTK